MQWQSSLAKLREKVKLLSLNILSLGKLRSSDLLRNRSWPRLEPGWGLQYWPYLPQETQSYNLAQQLLIFWEMKQTTSEDLFGCFMFLNHIICITRTTTSLSRCLLLVLSLAGGIEIFKSMPLNWLIKNKKKIREINYFEPFPSETHKVIW